MQKGKTGNMKVPPMPIPPKYPGTVKDSPAPPDSSEQVRVYEVGASLLRVKMDDAPITNVTGDPRWRERGQTVTNLDFDPPELEARYAKIGQESPIHGITLQYKTSRAEWEREQREKAQAETGA